MQKNNFIRKIAIAKILLFFLWPMAVSAAVATTPPDPFANISMTQVLVMAGVAILSGATALVIRLDSEMKRKATGISRIGLFATSHMLGSFLAGVLMFAISRHNEFSVWWELATVIMASFSGAKFLEKAAEMYTKGFTSSKQISESVSKY